MTHAEDVRSQRHHEQKKPLIEESFIRLWGFSFYGGKHEQSLLMCGYFQDCTVVSVSLDRWYVFLLL